VATNRRPVARRRPTSPARDEVNPQMGASHDAAEVANVPHGSINSTAVAREAANATGQPAAEVSRIEIQTADPNIRIIWLAPQKSEAPSPERDRNERDRNERDRNENADGK
ncbi:MAG: hypothetical protein ACJ741_06535, partial [Pyrinomonadaceae bacterium]